MNNECMFCRHWSELIAQAVGTELTAMCLNDKSASHGEYTCEYSTCIAFEAGEPIDKPGVKR